MKRLITGLATVGLALGAYAQGSINLDNSAPTFLYGITAGHTAASGGAYYGGVLTLQVWVLNGATPGNINNQAGANSSAAYANMVAAGYTLQSTFHTTIAAGNEGVISLGEVDMPGVSPAGSSPSIALVGMSGNYSNWVQAASSSGNGGVVAFNNTTADYTKSPHPTPPNIDTGWNTATDLALSPITPVPEPATFALAGLGAAALMIFRRRK